MTAVEERYRQLEAEAEEKRRRKARRQPLVLLAVINALVLFTGFTAAVDLNRLRTPGGTALRWTQAAVFGACEDYLAYSVADQPDPRTPDRLCRDLRAGTEQARANTVSIGLTRGPVTQSGGTAQVTVTVTRMAVPLRAVLHLRKVQGRWKVVRDASACALGCA